MKSTQMLPPALLILLLSLKEAEAAAEAAASMLISFSCYSISFQLHFKNYNQFRGWLYRIRVSTLLHQELHGLRWPC